MTAYVSAAAGPWSSAATWSPAGVPGPGDTAALLHAIILDVSAAVGTSAPGFTSNGLGDFAILINGVQGAANAGGNAAMVNGAGSLTLAPGVTLTVRGDIVCNTGPVTLGAGARILFDSTAAASPANQSYVLEPLNAYGTTDARLVTQGTEGARCSISATPGSGPPRITAGQKILGYSTYDCGIVQAVDTDFIGLGDASHPAITYRIGGPTAGAPYAWALSNCTFAGCGDVAPYSSVSGEVFFDVTGCTFSGSVGPNGFVLDVSDASAQAGYTRNVAGNTFDKALYVPNGAFCQVTGNVLLAAHTIVVSGTQAGLTVSGNFLHVGPGYAGGGGWNIPHGITYTGNQWVIDSPQDVNSHILLLNGGAGATLISGNSFLLDEVPQGYFGGNCIILEAAASGTPATNVVTITRNLVLPGVNTTSAGDGRYTAAGTLVTLLQNAAAQNFATVIEHNTACMPHGIGSIDPDENAAGAAGVFSSIRSNLFWAPSAVGSGYAVWWNTNGGARQPTVDEVLSANLGYNDVFNPLPATTCTVAGASVATPGYENGAFSAGTPGAHDIYADPIFGSRDANVATWDASLGGPGTTAHAVAQLAARAAGWTVAAYAAYLAVAFAPGALALKNAAHDGTDIGAYASSYVPPVPSAPTVLSASAPSGNYRAGGIVVIAVTFSVPVTLHGPMPSLDLNAGAASLSSQEGSTATFAFLVPPGLAAQLAVTDLNLNGGSIVSTATGLPLSGGVPAAALPGVYAAAAPPTITRVTAAAGTYAAGAVLPLYVATSAPVRLVDSAQPPVLVTSAGPAVYNPIGGTSQQMRFDLTVQPGTAANPLASVALSVGAGITDAAGNALITGGAFASLAGVIIDAVPPRVVSVSAAAGLYGAAAVVEILLALSKPCIVTGTLTLGTSAGAAAADPAQTTAQQLAFRMAVPAGQMPGALAVAGLLLAAGATVTDTSGNALSSPAGLAALLPDVIIDGTTAFITGAVATTTTVSLGGGSTEIRVSFSKPVLVPGGATVLLGLSNGAALPLAYATGPMLGFAYRPVAPSDVTPGVTITAITVSVTAGVTPVTITDLFGNPVSLAVGAGAIGSGLAVLAAPATLQPQGYDFLGGCGSWNRPTVPAEYIGVPTATLQQWLQDAQAGLQSLETGATEVNVSYSQGAGGKSVTYTSANADGLRKRIRDLAGALGLVRKRRPMRPFF